MAAKKSKEETEEECLDLIAQASELQMSAKDLRSKGAKKQLEQQAEELEKKAEDIMKEADEPENTDGES